MPPSCAECLEIWKPQLPGAFRDCTGIALLSRQRRTRVKQVPIPCIRFIFLFHKLSVLFSFQSVPQTFIIVPVCPHKFNNAQHRPDAYYNSRVRQCLWLQIGNLEKVPTCIAVLVHSDNTVPITPAPLTGTPSDNLKMRNFRLTQY